MDKVTQSNAASAEESAAAAEELNAQAALMKQAVLKLTQLVGDHANPATSPLSDIPVKPMVKVPLPVPGRKSANGTNGHHPVMEPVVTTRRGESPFEGDLKEF